MVLFSHKKVLFRRVRVAKTYSPLRYPGGKNQFYGYVEEIILQNNLQGCTYVEPFAGGAGVALRLLLENIVDRIMINDFDRSIYAFWNLVLNDTDWLCRKINDVNVTMEEYYIQREIQSRKEEIDIRELGFSTFFLNRTNRSGIIKAGPIGGYSQQGNYLLDCRFTKKNLIHRVEKIAEHREQIQVFNNDAIEFLHSDIWYIDQEYFVFFDPPYFEKGKALYTNFYNHDDHFQLSQYIQDNLNEWRWIVTYDCCEEIKAMYEQSQSTEISLNYSAQDKRKASEYLFYNRIELPAGL